MADFDTTQLRALATEYRNKADFFEKAADLCEQGYKADAKLAARAAELEIKVANLTAENARLKDNIDAKDAKITELEKI